MELVLTIRDADIGELFPPPTEYKERTAARAIVLDTEGKIALLHATNKGYHKLPGGGVEQGEDMQTALERELREEIGCAARNFRELGIIEEYRNQFPLHQFSHCYLADLQGEKGTPHLEPDELADGFMTEWLNLEDAVKTLENEIAIKNYEGKFIRLRDLTFIKAAHEYICSRL